MRNGERTWWAAGARRRHARRGGGAGDRPVARRPGRGQQGGVARGRGGRPEPAGDTRAAAGALEIGLSPEDRAGGSMARERRSQEGGRGSPRPRGRTRRSASLLGRLVYAGLILGLWAFIGVAG